MARFNAEGIDDLGLSLQEIAEIPDNVVDEMLLAGGDITVKAHKQKIEALGLVDSGQLRDSIKAKVKAGGAKDGWSRSVLVSPSGKRRNSKVNNATVGYVREFGAPKRGIPAKQWMRTANEECADAVVEAERTIYDKYLKSKDL